MNTGKICISVFARTAAGLIEQIRAAERQADIIELRLDHLDADECTAASIERIFSTKSQTPWIVTFRSHEQGGGRQLTSHERLLFWNQLFEADLVDLEEDLVGLFHPSGGKVICSFHDFLGVPIDVDEVYDRISHTPADIIKIAYTAKDAVDTIPIWRLLERARRDSRNIIPIAMGDAGKFTRALGLAHGAFLTYASLNAGAETASGQFNAADLLDVYRVREHDRDTRVFGVIGDPISQSMSPYMHNPAFRSESMNAVFVPLLVKNIAGFMSRMVRPNSREVELNFSGFSVTMPHKQSIMAHLDGVSPVADSIGAVNTVEIEDGRLIGHNTDAGGFISPLLEKFGSVAGARVAVFGAGGAARAVVHALKQERANVAIFARDGEKANALAATFGATGAAISTTKNMDGGKLKSSVDIVVNATPLGMKGAMEDRSLFLSDELEGLGLVYDLVTKAAETPILREARLAGVPTLGGVEMLIAQGARQFEIWTGKAAPIDVMRAAVDERMKAIKA